MSDFFIYFFAFKLFLIIIFATIASIVQISAGPLDTCTSNEFRCLDGSCIDKQLLCDGKKDCPDSSDEVFSACYDETCSGFRCSYGGCINLNLMCNNVTDCWDASDENKYICSSESTMIELLTELQGNCTDEYVMQCPKSNKCLTWGQVCNGVVDCKKGEDENFSLCESTQCVPDSFKCEKGGCINKDSLCDQIIDCADGSDELPAICMKLHANSLVQMDDNPNVPYWTTKTCSFDSMQNIHVSDFFTQFAYKPDGQVPDQSVVEMTCDDGYTIFGHSINSCYNSKWTNNDILCIRYCAPSPYSRSIVYSTKCSEKFDAVDCSDRSRLVNTELLVSCSPGYKSDSGHDQVGRHICNEQGGWTVVEENPICVPICGVKSAQHPDITPWTVSLFRRSTGKDAMHTFRCIGTILSPYIVLTANACFSEADEVNSHLFFKIAEGNHKINFTEDEDHGYVLHNLMEIHLGSFDKNHMAAILSLVKPFRFGGLVRPVCLAPSYDETQPMEIKGIFDSAELGKGYTEYENSKYYLTYFVASESLKYSVRSFISSIKDYISKSEQDP
ncbi:modular serine protease-like [Drosophila hydei]|uniref:Modular serine protease-like n=1 Tax=Drosophila hydei TaxID=7224 RepID=A0A6J2SX57_DROHY|nr:modular serine protease-like [Drosophila hydei]